MNTLEKQYMVTRPNFVSISSVKCALLPYAYMYSVNCIVFLSRYITTTSDNAILHTSS